MKKQLSTIILGTALFACTKAPSSQPSSVVSPSIQEQNKAAEVAVNLLQKGDFRAASQQAKLALDKDPKNPQARLVSAITTYGEATRSFMIEVFTPHQFSKSAELALLNLEHIEEDLKTAAEAKAVSLELCPACWEKDWNGNGAFDARDQLLFQLEVDANGQPLPENDPLRKPTFRFDHGDVYWALAMINFQEGFLRVALSYDWSVFTLNNPSVTIPLRDASQMKKAKEEFLQGLKYSSLEREAYLAETDDDREFVPNPKQKNHPIPLAMDDAFYQTWSIFLSGTESLLQGKESLDLGALAQIGEHQWKNPPTGKLDVSMLFDSPADIKMPFENGEAALRDEASLDFFLEPIFGAAYRSNKPTSSMTKEITRITKEVMAGDDNIEKKLKYFLWAN